MQRRGFLASLFAAPLAWMGWKAKPRKGWIGETVTVRLPGSGSVVHSGGWTEPGTGDLVTFTDSREIYVITREEWFCPDELA